MVPVDFEIPGCPINRKEFATVVKALLLGKKPQIPNYPVCVECKMAENQCVFEKGMTCMGPVTRAGCGACCVTEGSICWGCRGLVDDPNVDSQREILAKYGLGVRDILRKFSTLYRIFGGGEMNGEKIIKVEHLTRVEGHGNIHVRIKDGKVEECQWQVVEAPRFFEAMLHERKWHEVAHITSRICGICSIGHTLASLKATEAAMGVTISEQTAEASKAPPPWRKPAEPCPSSRLSRTSGSRREYPV